MSDLYNMLIDELEKNNIFVRYSTIEPEITLDLSEHDKPFKVKIRELEESYQKNVREIHTLEKDNLFFKQRITEIENKRNRMYEISKILRKNCNYFYKENKELKQRIAELEDKIRDRDKLNRCLCEKNAKSGSENEKVFDCINRIIGNTKEEMDIILNTLDFELQNNKVSVLKENEKVVGLDFSKHDEAFEDKIAELENIINNKLGGWDKHGITYQEIMDMKAENQELKQITKGYEDKIAELKKDYKTASELLGKYQQENESLKKRVVELEDFSCQAEQETESLVEKLNQRIVKLEKSRSEWIDKTVEWQQKCEKLESKETEIVSGIDTSNSLACAKSLIEHMTHCEKFMIMPERDVQTFSVEELKEIADYLMVYYKHHKDRDAEDTISF